MAIPKEIIEEVRSRCDIVDLVSSYLPELRKNEELHINVVVRFIMKTPSFTVNQERQIYHCLAVELMEMYLVLFKNMTN